MFWQVRRMVFIRFLPQVLVVERRLVISMIRSLFLRGDCSSGTERLGFPVKNRLFIKSL